MLAHGPITSAELTDCVGAHADSPFRLRRALTTLGLCAERDDGAFELTPLGSHLAGLQHQIQDDARRYLIAQSGQYPFENLIALAKQKLVGLDDLALAAHFKAVEDLPNLAEFQRSYMVVDVDLGRLVEFFQEWAERLFSIAG